MADPAKLSRRERQIMDIIYARAAASVSDVLADLPDPPTRTAVRTLMRILEDKGHLKHHKKARQFIRLPSRILVTSHSPSQQMMELVRLI